MATQDKKYSELTQEQRIKLAEEFRRLAKDFKLSETDLAFQALSHAKTDGLMSKVRIVAAQLVDAKGISVDDNEAYKAEIESEKKAVLSKIGFDTTTKTNELTVQQLTNGSIKLWNEYGDLLRAYFEQKKAQKSAA